MAMIFVQRGWPRSSMGSMEDMAASLVGRKVEGQQQGPRTLQKADRREAPIRVAGQDQIFSNPQEAWKCGLQHSLVWLDCVDIGGQLICLMNHTGEPHGTTYYAGLAR